MKDTTLAQQLISQQTAPRGLPYLCESAPVLRNLPPFLLKDTPAEVQDTHLYAYEFFSSREELQNAYPEASILKGHPYLIGEFLKNEESIFLDFEQLGSVHLFKGEKRFPLNPKMTLWLNYALSPELWGPEGKWTRFHKELNQLLLNLNLLRGPSVPGRYPLNPNSLKNDILDTDFVLVLPWDFSLSELRKLVAQF